MKTIIVRLDKLFTHLLRSRVIFDKSGGGSSGRCCITNSVFILLLLLLPLDVFIDELVDIGTTIDDETASRPRDNFNISAPNWCNAVIVDGVGSGMLHMNEIVKKACISHYVIDGGAHLESGSHSSCVSSVDNSVSVDVAEWAWFGVDGRLVLSNRRHVHRRSTDFNSLQSKYNMLCLMVEWYPLSDVYSLCNFEKMKFKYYLVAFADPTIHSPSHSLEHCHHRHISFVVAEPTDEPLNSMWST